MRECTVKHSESKEAWNIISTIPGDKYKIARVPYHNDKRMSEEYNHNQKHEAYKDTVLMSKAPEMLDMLKEMVKELEFHGFHSSKTTNEARELIKEATTL